MPAETSLLAIGKRPVLLEDIELPLLDGAVIRDQHLWLPKIGATSKQTKEINDCPGARATSHVTVVVFAQSVACRLSCENAPLRGMKEGARRRTFQGR